MFITRLVAMATLAVPCAAFATNTFNVNTSSCSGSLVSSFVDGVSLACDGDYLLSGGLIESSQSIFLSATGSISITDLTLNAPVLNISTGSSLVFGDGVTLLTPGLTNGGVPPQIVTPSLTIQVDGGHQTIPGRALQVNGIGAPGVISWTPAVPSLSTVPEPSSMGLLLGGLLSAGLFMERKHRKS